MNRYEIKRIAANFWKDVGKPEPFPRSLEPAVYWALPLGVFKLPRLWVSDVQVWLAEQGIQFELETEDRSLHGCLIARLGRGCVFLNGTDSDAELRFSLAHEVAHFLLDYHLPRQAAVNRLGPSVLEVFDGLRRSSSRNPPRARSRCLESSVCRISYSFIGAEREWCDGMQCGGRA